VRGGTSFCTLLLIIFAAVCFENCGAKSAYERRLIDQRLILHLCRCSCESKDLGGEAFAPDDFCPLHLVLTALRSKVANGAAELSTQVRCHI
jgi:hypothetical protein